MAAKMQKMRRLSLTVEVETTATAAQMRSWVRDGCWGMVTDDFGLPTHGVTVLQVQANVIRPTRPRPNARPDPVPAKRKAKGRKR